MNLRLITLLAMVVPASVFAQAPRPHTRPAAAPAYPRPRTEATIVAEWIEAISGKDPAPRQEAMEAIRARLQARGLSDLRSNILRPLFVARQYKDVADLALEGILATPQETKAVEAALALRIKSLLAMGKAQQAMGEAKSLYNVSSMIGTADAILLVAECLQASKPDDTTAYNSFRDEQMVGATTQPVAPATPPFTIGTLRTSAILAGVKVDSQPFDAAQRHFAGEDATSLLARGNLLLLADRPKDARPIFERMYSLAGADLVEASEALARCMKAEDGTIGRANSWILSIRPKKP